MEGEWGPGRGAGGGGWRFLGTEEAGQAKPGPASENKAHSCENDGSMKASVWP